MEYLSKGLFGAFALLFSGDAEFLLVVFTSIELAVVSTLLAGLFGIPFGLFLSIRSFRGKAVVERTLETLLSLPTVLIGLIAYAFFSRRGPLGELELLYTKSAIVIGQTVLIFPLIAALTNAAMKSVAGRYGRALTALGANTAQLMAGLMREGRAVLIAALLTGFGRVFSEVGIAMMLGGNIRGETRTITTAIALETARGEFALGIALGIVLLVISLALTMVVAGLRKKE